MKKKNIKFIDNPIFYLEKQYGEDLSFIKIRDKRMDIGNLQQNQYETYSGVGELSGRAVGNCTLSSMCNTFDYFRKNGYDRIPEDPLERYQQIRNAVSFYMRAPLGGIEFYCNALLTERVWKAFGYPGIHSRIIFFSSLSKAIQLASQGKPFLLSILSGRYHHHTVAVCGYAVFQNEGQEYRFLRIQDNWSNTSRYLYEKEKMICMITELII